MRALVRKVALALVSVAGVASLLATSPPPPPSVLLSVEPAVVCAGDDVTLRWDVRDGSDFPAPDDLRLATAPIDAFDPPIEGTPIAGEGTLVVQPLLPAYISATTETYVDVYQLPSIAVFPCDLTGAQYATHWTTQALAGDDADGTLVAAFAQAGGTDATRIARLDAALEPLWETTVDARVQGLSVSSAGDVVAIGSAVDTPDDAPPSARRAFVRRYDAVGDVAWTTTFGPDEADGPTTEALAVTWLGDDVVVVGRSLASGAPDEGFVARIDVAGDVVWERRIQAGGSGGGNARAAGVRVGPDGHLYVGGTTTGEVGGARVATVDAFLVTFDVDGVRLPWSQQLAGHDDAGAVALGLGDTVALVGASLVAWPLGGDEPAWSAPAPAGATWRSVTEGAAGTLLVAGQLTVPVDLPAAWDLDHDDVVLQHLAGDGGALGERRFGSLGFERLEAVAAWPSARPGVAVIGGRTGGHFLAPIQSSLEAYVLEVPLE